ncbi:MAG: 30S ribosomal protein S8 [Endomicrobiia bacterium]|nr:30S ribosomal protein S8 [Endomicrobiia bacterium]
MPIIDPVADFFTAIRNANAKLKEKVDVPASKTKIAVSKILKEEGFISNYKVIDDYKQGILRVYLKYTPQKEAVIKEIKRLSTPGRRIYDAASELPRLRRGMSVVIVSTSKGIMTARKAREAGLGGEVMGYIW